MGRWLKVNGEGIYGSLPWIYQNDTATPNVWYTRGSLDSGNGSLTVYAFVLEYPYDTNELDIYPLGKEISFFHNVLLAGLDMGVAEEILRKDTTQIVMLGMENTKIRVLDYKFLFETLKFIYLLSLIVDCQQKQGAHRFSTQTSHR